MKDISSNSIDLILCDLPYGCLTGQNVNKNLMRMENGIATGGRAQTKNGLLQGCSWDIPIDLESFWKEIKRIRRNDHTPTIHFCTTKFGYKLIKSNEKEFRYDLIWDKQRGVSFLSANKMPMRSHEMIYVFSKAGAYYNRVDISGSTRCALSVIPQTGGQKKGGHPTEKPMELYKWLIERYCPVNGVVLDPTGGSCNSVFQAHASGRNGIAIEMNEEFYNKAVARKINL